MAEHICHSIPTFFLELDIIRSKTLYTTTIIIIIIIITTTTTISVIMFDYVAQAAFELPGYSCPLPQPLE